MREQLGGHLTASQGQPTTSYLFFVSYIEKTFFKRILTKTGRDFRHLKSVMDLPLLIQKLTPRAKNFISLIFTILQISLMFPIEKKKGKK